MNFKILTLFPNYFTSPLEEALLKKAIDKKIINVELHNLRDYSDLEHQSVDDTPYGGGAGMVLRADVLSKAINELNKDKKSLVILTDPSGEKFNQSLASTLSEKEDIILICGRYEGVDERFKELYVDREISIGDYVLNGGEAAALVIIDAVSRLVKGVIGSPESLEFESFSEVEIDNKKVQILDYPTYTKPADFEGESVPEVLLSGNHGEIAKWRKEKALSKTKRLRGDLLK
ncbi:MAG TPA: tRNA (guanosine(37)-N1)-methyltransferase TrmD [Candidatus Saccharimonadales bacterium]|nr:tRNA (guanosine(37)-N1)-methyltransferase TrmD [Candidatus Saccharimonadales bacterium]